MVQICCVLIKGFECDLFCVIQIRLHSIKFRKMHPQTGIQGKRLTEKILYLKDRHYQLSEKLDLLEPFDIRLMIIPISIFGTSWRKQSLILIKADVLAADADKLFDLFDLHMITFSLVPLYTFHPVECQYQNRKKRGKLPRFFDVDTYLRFSLMTWPRMVMPSLICSSLSLE